MDVLINRFWNWSCGVHCSRGQIILVKEAGKDKLNLESLVIQLNRNENSEESEQVVDLILDKSKKDMATLMKLNSLKKRVHFIKHVLGDWKPTPRYKTLTDQVVQV